MKINLEKIRETKLFVATPSYGGDVSVLFTKSMIGLTHLLTKSDIHYTFFSTMSESLVQRARNLCVDEFMRSNFSHLLFIDSDIEFNPDYVLELLQLSTTQYPNDVLTGLYPKKSISWERVMKAVRAGFGDPPTVLGEFTSNYVFNSEDGVDMKDLDVPTSVFDAGTGFMLIPRSVFEQFKTSFEEQRYIRNDGRHDDDRTMWAYFDCKIVDDTYLSEDYWFCHKVREMGRKIYTCPWMKLNHFGKYNYKGNPTAVRALGEVIE